eukprot:51732-Rhodomonas_salina.4
MPSKAWGMWMDHHGQQTKVVRSPRRLSVPVLNATRSTLWRLASGWLEPALEQFSQFSQRTGMRRYKSFLSVTECHCCSSTAPVFCSSTSAALFAGPDWACSSRAGTQTCPHTGSLRVAGRRRIQDLVAARPTQ